MSGLLKVSGEQRVTLSVKGILLIKSSKNKANTSSQWQNKKENPSGNYDKNIHIIKQVYRITWLVPIFLDKAKFLNLLDLEMSKCSLKVFMATCSSLGIWNLLPRKRLHWSHDLRILPSGHRGLACQRAHVKNRNLAKVTSSPALTCICVYLLTA